MRSAQRKRKGSILVLSMFVMAILILFAGMMLQLTVSNIMMISKATGVTKAYWIAIAGINQQKHDLQEYYFQNQMTYKPETDFGGGKYKVGTATLIGQGIHRSIIVALGEYEYDENISDYAYKKCVYAQCGMNTSTDYLHFFEGPLMNYLNGSSTGAAMYGGPVHVNGDIRVGHSGDDVVFIKPKEDYGPVISCSGTLYNFNIKYFEAAHNTAFGEGTVAFPFTFNFSLYSDVFYSAKTGGGFKWPGDDAVGPVPYDYEKYPSKVDKTGIDGSNYSYDLVQHKANGGAYIKVPKLEDINYDTFSNAIDEDWYIENTEWRYNDVAKSYKIINEIVNGGTVITNYKAEFANPEYSLGYLQFGSALGPSVSFAGINNLNAKYIKYVWLKSSETKNTYYLPCMAFPPYTIDKSSKTIRFESYNHTVARTDGANVKGFNWTGFYFEQNPISGKWRGKRYNSLIGISQGIAGNPTEPQANQSFPVTTTRYEALPNSDPPFNFTSPVVLNVATSDPYAEEVRVNGSVWSRVTSFNAGGGNEYQIDFTSGTISFGDYHDTLNPGGSGARPSVGAEIKVTWTHGFDPNITVYCQDPVEVLELDLNKITEESCPRDKKYPDDPDKYGIIYSKVPLMIKGVPKVPVTIVCEEDIYLGPVNSSYLNENLDLSIPSSNYGEDDEELCPVGIITKKNLYMDFTYAPAVPPYEEIILNSFKTEYNDEYAPPYKLLTHNKVYIGYNWGRDTLNYYNYGSTTRSGDNMALTRRAIGGIVHYYEKLVKSDNATHYNARGIWGDNQYKIIGSMYTYYDADYVKAVTLNYDDWRNLLANGVYYQDVSTYLYSNSFRYWKKNKPLTSGPPPHIPIDMDIESLSSGNINAGEAFFTNLQTVLDRDLDYTTELSQAISALLETIEK
ncbi:MAG: hypothetical protein V1752_03040 [Candidatus Firestonebacteria bacterium]